jgi:peptidoglycan/LPS O-acetylase OafA/YrhL
LLSIPRFPAAAGVRLFHLRSRAPLPLGPRLTPLVANGALAMTLFFLLSGAVLALGHRDLRLEAADLATFYRSRVARIMSAFLTIQVLGLFWFPPALVGGGPKWTSVNAFSFAGLQAWLLARMSYRANGGTWSISVELFLRAFSRRPAGHAACPPPIRDRPGGGLFSAGLQCAGVDRLRSR